MSLDTRDSLQTLLTGANSLQDHLVALRRSFALQPELSGEEAETASTIARRLQALGLPTETGVGGHGVVGVVEGARPGPTIVYRADMDAMPILDTLDTPYRSMVLGVKHACGHDAHMAIALGLAQLFGEVRAKLPGRLVFLFQPAEESLDGARAVLRSGVLQQWSPAAVLALHTFPIPVGTLGLVSGLCLPGVEEFRVRLYAPAGNLEILTEEALAALESLSTLSFPKTAEGFTAVIDEMLAGAPLDRELFLTCWRHPEGHVPPYHIVGLMSIADFAQKKAVYAHIRATLDQVVAQGGATYDLEVTFTNPPLVNDPDLVHAVTPVVESVLGESKTLRLKAPYPFAHEDLSRYSSMAPTALLVLGTANAERGIASLHHTPDYDIDEAALGIGARVMAAVLWTLLNREEQDTPQTLPGHRDAPSGPPATSP